jgi:hypothetical protein
VKIGLKYCGGCNPQYDRVALVDRIRESLEDRAEFVPWDCKEASLILVVAGCETACVDPGPFEDLPYRIITCERDAQSFIREMININGVER